jgi:hypothetical protein
MKYFKFICLLVITFNSSFPQTSKHVWRPFSDNSPWNQKIPENPKIDPNSNELIDDFASRGSIYINMNEWSIPVYFVNSDTTPKYIVHDSRKGIYGKGFSFPRQIPIPANAVPSPPEGGDNHLCIIDKAKNLEWGMWWARKSENNEWSTGLGAVTDLNGTGVAEPWYAVEREFDSHRARASGFPLIAGLVRVEEIKVGKIEHALVFAYDHCRSEFFIPPASTAQATTQNIKNTSGIPMGGRIQLDPKYDIENSGLSESGKIIAKALQEYGAYCGDYAGANVIYAENSPAVLKEWEGLLDSEEMYNVFSPEMIKENFRVLHMGVLLPGQNFENPPPYIISFGFKDQITKTNIDFFDRTVELKISGQADITNLAASYKVYKKGTKVYINDIEQINGITSNDFSSAVTYTLIAKDGKTNNWIVFVEKQKM